MSVQPPEQPRGRRGSPTPRRVNQSRGILPKLPGEQTRETGAEHVFPKIQPGRWTSREETTQQLLQHIRSARRLVWNHPEEREQFPFIEPRHRNAPERTSAAP